MEIRLPGTVYSQYYPIGVMIKDIAFGEGGLGFDFQAGKTEESVLLVTTWRFLAALPRH